MNRHAEPNFLAYKRAGVDGEQVELESAIDEWDSILDDMDRRNGWTDEHSPKPDDDHDELVKAAARGLRTALQFMWDGVVLTDPASMRTAIRRWVAISNQVCPDALRGVKVAIKSGPRGRLKLVDGPPLTLQQLAMMPQVRTCEKQLQRMAAEFMTRLEAE
jgi:hypothetical protein